MPKLWKFVYIDDIETRRVKITDEEADSHSPAHTVPGNVEITYDIPRGKCFIHSNEEIPGLKLLGENQVTIGGKN